MEDILAVILAGGRGSRLGPLTKDRAKPAVPWGGSYRLIDFPLSISVGNKIRRTLVFTQYKPMKLENYINDNWRRFTGFNETIEIASPEQTSTTQNWFEGTADALLQHQSYIERFDVEYVLVLSGDHIMPPKRFRLDEMMEYHQRKDGALTIIAKKTPVKDEMFEMVEGKRRFPFGVLQVNDDYRVLNFTEKPNEPARMPDDKDSCLASMGIYIFDTKALLKLLKGNEDFGKQLIPSMLAQGRDIHAFTYDDYWEDVGTIRAYYDSNMGLLSKKPSLDLHELSIPRVLEEYDPVLRKKVRREEIVLRNFGGSYPPSRVKAGDSYNILSGSSVEGETINSIIRNSTVDSSTQLEGVILMKSTLKDCNLKRTIVDSNNSLVGVTIDPDKVDYTIPRHEIDQSSGLWIEQDPVSGAAYYLDPVSKIAIVPRREPKETLY